MPSINPSLCFRIDPLSMAKLKCIAHDEFKSGNEILVELVLKKISEYEKENGVFKEKMLKHFLDEINN